MNPNLIEMLPKIVQEGRKVANRILDNLSGSTRVLLQTNEFVIPSKDVNYPDMFRQLSSSGQFSQRDINKSDFTNKLIYGDNLLVMQALLAGDAIQGIPSLRNSIDLIYIDPPYDSKADYRTKITLPGTNIEKKPTVLEQYAYADTWKDGTISYLKFLYPRLLLMRELLSEKGSIYVHIDWHVGHYVKILLDDVFGKDNFRNEIVWHYYNKLQGNIGRFASNHDSIFSYKKNLTPFYTPMKEIREKPKKQQKRVWDKNSHSLIQAKDENGNLIYYDDTERTIDDVWRLPYIMPADLKQKLNYSTQKPTELIERIIKSSSIEGALIADFFAGSGTTGAVAEKLGRKWIMSDIGRPATMVMRKRMIDQNAKPFLYQSVGDYQTEQATQSLGSNYRIGDLAQVVLGLYGALSFNQDEAQYRNLGYIKPKTLIYADSPNKLCGKNTLTKAQSLRDTYMGGWDNVVVLGWNFVGDIGQIIESLKDSKLEVRVIPPDLLDKLASKASYEKLVKTGAIKFSSLQYLSIKPPVALSYDNESDEIEVELDNYIVLSPDALPLDEANKEKIQQVISNNPLDLIEYWSIDPDFDGAIFRSIWQDYRESNEDLRVVRKAKLLVPKKDGKRKICIKAVDVFGWESEVIQEI